MTLKEKYEFDTLVNEAERLVLEEMEKQLETAEFKNTCRCQDCILDMAALALNNVKPMYRVSLLGSLYTAGVINTPYIEEIRQAVRKAIVKIRENPSHG
ncbi:MAG: late competence development ComFB family protein [Spirochaetales bacterium]